MSSTILATYGTYHPHHQKLKQLGCTPCERDVFGKIAGLIHRLDRAFVHLQEFANDLDYCTKSISRAVTGLVKKNLIRRTGQKAHGFFPFVEILPLTDDIEQPALITPSTKMSMIGNQKVHAHPPGGHPQEKKTKELKQREEIVCSEKIFIQEKEILIETIRGFGIGKNTAKDFITRYGLERVTYQAEHLEDLLRRGDDIKNPAGWLQKAISKKYQNPKERVTTDPVVEDDNRKQAHRLFQQAEQEYRSNDIAKAQELAERSNALFPSSDAKKMIAEIEAKHQRQKRREEVLRSVPPEVFAQVLERKREEQKTVLMKFGIRKLSTIAEDAAYEAAIDEVIKISSTFPANAPAR